MHAGIEKKSKEDIPLVQDKLAKLGTTAIETEMVNNYPLTYLDDSLVNTETITSSHLVFGRKTEVAPSLDISDELNDAMIDDSA